MLLVFLEKDNIKLAIQVNGKLRATIEVSKTIDREELLSNCKNHPNVNNFDHESSWIYFLANILNMECHTYGVGGASMGDIFYTLKKCKTSYDYYIIFHTDPLRKGIFSNLKFELSTCKSTKKFIADKMLEYANV